jgi:hypothetical protein
MKLQMTSQIISGIKKVPAHLIFAADCDMRMSGNEDLWIPPDGPQAIFAAALEKAKVKLCFQP